MRSRSERGSATVETVLLTPIAFALVLAIIQAALWIHARQLVQAAAEEAVAAARISGATAESGQGVARQLLAPDKSLIGTPTVQVRVGAERVTADVRAEMRSLLGIRIIITGAAAGPTERFRADT